MLSIHQDGAVTILTSDHVGTALEQHYFDANYLLQHNLVTDRKTGRATTYFFKHQQEILVLRHYWRGGLIGKLLSDQYFYTGLKNTRTFKEFELLATLNQQGLPVPQPIAAKIETSGLIYRGDIITKALPSAQSLLDILKQRELTAAEIQLVADTIAEFHSIGVNHADLNINNILFSEGQVYLIDFDRGTLNSPSKAIANSNIQRLKRSFEKEANRNVQFHWTGNNWQQFNQAYLSKLSISAD